jgi:hypothetical protein
VPAVHLTLVSKAVAELKKFFKVLGILALTLVSLLVILVMYVGEIELQWRDAAPNTVAFVGATVFVFLMLAWAWRVIRKA